LIITTLLNTHYISGAHDPEVSKRDALIRSVRYETGLVPSTFPPITDFPLKKKPSSNDVADTRLIQLFDAQFNINNKKLGRDTMRYAEEQNTISQSQYGSRKGCRSCKVVTGKVLNYDIRHGS
jgi:hypothetical protein